jgi:biotin carboxyl carrier protein
MGEHHGLYVDGTTYETRLTRKYHQRRRFQPRSAKRVQAVIPGSVEQVYVRAGQVVKRGDILLVLEAMKMRNPVLAPRSGRVKQVWIEPGQLVAKGDLLVEFQ